MKLAHGLSLLATFAIAGAGAWIGQGCSNTATLTPVDGGTTPTPDTGTGNPDTGGGGGSDSGGGGSDSGGGGSDSGGGSDAGGGSDGAVAQDCTSYCTAIQAACTGANAQYATTLECMNACSYFPPGMAGDQTGFTLGCKIVHAGKAVTMPNPHCWHAGPYGYGVCGATVDSFCTLAVGWCSPDAGYVSADGGPGIPPYASQTDCTTAAMAYTEANIGADGGFYAGGPGSGDTFDCRQYHLGAALNSAPGGATQTLHCQHPGAVSPVCHP
jgi:hypothetical protein